MKEKIQRFEDLEVWQKAHGIVLEIYRTTKVFPPEEKFGLVSQMRRAAVSIPANIAEGFKKKGKKDKTNFYNISQGSLEELRYYIILSKDLGYIEDTDEIMKALDEAGRMLHGLINSEFRAVIPSENPWRTASPAEAVEKPCYYPARQRMLYTGFKPSAGKDIQHVEYPECPSRTYSIMQEIPCPYMPWKLCLCGLKGPYMSGVFLPGDQHRFLKSGRAVYSVGLLEIYTESPLPQFSPYHPVTPGRMFKSNLFYGSKEFCIILSASSVEGCPGHIKSLTESCYRELMLSMQLLYKHFYIFPAQRFFLMMSVRAWISSSFSARSLLSLEFSSSSTLSRFASEAFMPLYLCLHRYMVLGLIPYFLATEETELPGRSASAMILIIWSMENLFGLIPLYLLVYTLVNKILHYRCLIFGEQIRKIFQR